MFVYNLASSCKIQEPPGRKGGTHGVHACALQNKESFIQTLIKSLGKISVIFKLY